MAENPPAFPPHGASFDYEGVQTGMSLRDWFAGKALVGILAAAPNTKESAPSRIAKAMASAAYALADAMLAERAK